MDSKIVIKADTNEMQTFFKECSKLEFTDSLTKIINRLLGLIDFSQELRTVNINDSSTLAGELLIRFEPSNRLRRIFSAILARDVDALIVEHDNLI